VNIQKFKNGVYSTRFPSKINHFFVLLQCKDESSDIFFINWEVTGKLRVFWNCHPETSASLTCDFNLNVPCSRRAQMNQPSGSNLGENPWKWYSCRFPPSGLSLMCPHSQVPLSLTTSYEFKWDRWTAISSPPGHKSEWNGPLILHKCIKSRTSSCLVSAQNETEKKQQIRRICRLSFSLLETGHPLFYIIRNIRLE
jgi:hypothetical protein